MHPILLSSYKTEYENSSITKEAIQKKYSLTEEDTKEWSKTKSKEPQVITPTLITPQTQQLPTDPEEPSEPDNIDKAEVMKDIGSFKEKVVTYALAEMNSPQANLLEIKEVKDLVHMVNTVETSFKDDKDTGPTFNILIQNITERFRDDC